MIYYFCHFLFGKAYAKETTYKPYQIENIPGVFVLLCRSYSPVLKESENKDPKGKAEAYLVVRLSKL